MGSLYPVGSSHGQGHDMAHDLFLRPLADNHLHPLSTRIRSDKVPRPFPLHVLFHRLQLHRLHLGDGSIQRSPPPFHLG